MLLVLDGFEPLADAAPLITELLATAPAVKALVTSRVVLRLSGEHQYAVPALDDGDALALFVDRARSVDPGFSPTGDEQAIADIARRLDGLPLAIELAAGRARLMSPRALVGRLDDRLALLSGGPLDAPDRQRTLRSTIAWSWDLLTTEERELLRRLAVFAAGFDASAVEAISDHVETLDVLGSLTDKSLVARATREGEIRFSLLDTIRAFARERGREAGGWEEARGRHAAHYLELAEAAAPHLRSRRSVEWLARLDLERDNLRAAMSWFIERRDGERTVRLGWAIWALWWMRGRLDEAARWSEAVIDVTDSLSAELRAPALTGSAYQVLNAGDLVLAAARLREALELYRSEGDEAGIALTTGMLGHAAALGGDLEQAERLLDDSLERYRRLGDARFTLQMLNLRAWIPEARGDVDRAAELFAEVLQLAPLPLADTIPVLIGLANLARTQMRRGDVAEAEALYTESVRLAVQAGDEGGAGYSLSGLAAVAAARDEPLRAASLAAGADALLETTGAFWLTTYAGDRAGLSGTAGGSPDDAELERARARGRGMTLDELVDLALGPERSTL